MCRVLSTCVGKRPRVKVRAFKDGQRTVKCSACGEKAHGKLVGSLRTGQEEELTLSGATLCQVLFQVLFQY